MRPAIDTTYVEQRRKFDAYQAQPDFTPSQLAVIRKIVADAVIGARIIHPIDCTEETVSAIRRAIQGA